MNLFFDSNKKMMGLAGQVNDRGEGVLSIDGKVVNVKYFPGSRNQRSEFSLYTNGPFGAEMVVRRETFQDKFYMNIGLNHQLQIPDQELSDKLYFECDVPEFLRQIFLNSDAKPIVLDILTTFNFIEITKDICKFKQTPCSNFGDITKGSVDDAARKLLKFVSFIPASEIPPPAELDSFKFWRIVLYSIGIGAAILGAVFTSWGIGTYRVVDESRAWFLTAQLFLVIFSIAVFLAFMIIKGFSTSSRVFIRFSLYFGIGALLCLRFGGAVYNGIFDKSSLVMHDQIIYEKYTSTSKGNTYYHVFAAPWHQGMNGWGFTVDRSTYDFIRPNITHCQILTKSGALAFEWVEFERVE